MGRGAHQSDVPNSILEKFRTQFVSVQSVKIHKMCIEIYSNELLSAQNASETHKSLLFELTSDLETSGSIRKNNVNEKP